MRRRRIAQIIQSAGCRPQASFVLLSAFGSPHVEYISLFVNCGTQEEIDELWEKLSEGGEKQPCGWLKDRFGVSWQIVPSVLGEMIGDPRSGNSEKVMEALLKMSKIDIETLKRAYAQRT